MTRIVANEKGIQILVDDYPMKPIQAKRIMKYEIPRFFTGELIPETHPLRPRPLYTDDERDECSHLTKSMNLKEGWSYRDTLISITTTVDIFTFEEPTTRHPTCTCTSTFTF